MARGDFRNWTSAMAAGVADRLWDIGNIVNLVEAAEPKLGKRGPYKKQVVPV